MSFTRLLILSILLLVPQLMEAQDLISFNEDRINMTQNGMIVLGSWAAANIVVNPILAANSSGSRKYFYQMNAYWNIVNLAIAGVGYFGLLGQDAATFTLAESLKEQGKIEKLLLFNAGLDVAYVLGGLYLRERSKNVENNRNRLKGFGESIMLQGAWLFTFDLIFYLVQNNHGSQLVNTLSAFRLSPEGFQMVLRF